MENTELMTAQDTGIALATANEFSDMFAQADKSDKKVPTIYAVQKMSKVVDEKIASPGDIIENVNKMVIGNEKEPAQIIVFGMMKTYLVQPVVAGQKDLMGKHHELFNKNSSTPYYTTNEGVEIKDEDIKKHADYKVNRPCYNFFVFFNGDSTFTPYILSLYGQGLTKAGRPMYQFLYKQYMQSKAAPFNFLFNLQTELVQNKFNASQKWYVMKAQVAFNENKSPLLSPKMYQEQAMIAAKNVSFLAQSLNDSANVNDDMAEMQEVDAVDSDAQF